MICITAPFLFLELVFVVFAAEELCAPTRESGGRVESDDDKKYGMESDISAGKGY